MIIYICVIETYSTYFLSNRIPEFTVKPCDQKKKKKSSTQVLAKTAFEEEVYF